MVDLRVARGPLDVLRIRWEAVLRLRSAGRREVPRGCRLAVHRPGCWFSAHSRLHPHQEVRAVSLKQGTVVEV